MSGFDGRITVNGDREKAQSLIDVAIKLADRLHAWKQTSGLKNLVRGVDLGDGHYAVVTDLENMRAIHISTTPEYESIPKSAEELLKTSEYYGVGVIDVVNGRVDNTRKTAEKTKGPDGKTIEVSRITKFLATATSEDRYTTDYMRARLAVEKYPKDPDAESSPWKYSQHSTIRPTTYSGEMSKVVQLLLGIGFIPKNTYERQWMHDKHHSLLTNYDVGEGVKSAFSLYEQDRLTYLQKLNLDDTETPPAVHVQFESTWMKTHGITFDGAGKAYVLEISSRGVHLMPLYLDPVSVSEAGRARYLEMQPELEEFFDKFGGMPIGFPVPTGKIFTEMKKAKEIIELVSSEDIQEFYGKSMYTNDVGWTINSTGIEAHNTCYDYDDNKVGVGYHYKVSIKLGTDELPDWTDDTLLIKSALGLTKIWEVNKARRMDDNAAANLASSLRATNADIKYLYKKFQNMDEEIEQSLDAHGSLSLVRSGRLYHPAKPKGQPQIKFPCTLPQIMGLLSHDFGILKGGTRPTKITCNTPMFVAFVKDTLEVVYYYYTTAAQTKFERYDTREPCQYIGSWESGYLAANSVAYVAGNFYSTSTDWREVLSTNGIYKVKSKGVAAGMQTHFYGGAPYTCIGAAKVRRFNITSVTEHFKNANNTVSVAIPLWSRDCYYMGRLRRESQMGASQHSEPVSIYTGKADLYTVFNWVCHHWYCGEPPGDLQEPDIAYQNPNDGTGYNYIESITVGTRSCVASMSIPDYYVFECYPDDKPDHLDYSCCVVPNTGLTKIVVSSPNGKVIGDARVPELPDIPKTYKVLGPSVTKSKGEVKLIGQYTGVETTKKYSITTINDPTFVAGGDGVEQIPEGQSLSGWWWEFSPDDSGGTPYLSNYGSALGGDVVNYMPDMQNFPYISKGEPKDMQSESGGIYVGVLT